MLYVASKDGTNVYVTPESLALYAEQGYQIYKLVEEPVVNPEKEAKLAQEQTHVTVAYQAPEPVLRRLGDE